MRLFPSQGRQGRAAALLFQHWSPSRSVLCKSSGADSRICVDSLPRVNSRPHDSRDLKATAELTHASCTAVGKGLVTVRIFSE